MKMHAILLEFLREGTDVVYFASTKERVLVARDNFRAYMEEIGYIMEGDLKLTLLHTGASVNFKTPQLDGTSVEHVPVVIVDETLAPIPIELWAEIKMIPAPSKDHTALLVHYLGD